MHPESFPYRYPFSSSLLGDIAHRILSPERAWNILLTDGAFELPSLPIYDLYIATRCQVI